VRDFDGSGAAGGFAGALVALGGQLLPGFVLVADELDLHDAIAAADLVITGEGYLDEQSFEGKVVGGVQSMAIDADKPVGAIVGDAAPEVAARIDHISLADAYGMDKAMNEPLWCIERAASTLLERLTAPR
jgi:glycerate kinase